MVRHNVHGFLYCWAYDIWYVHSWKSSVVTLMFWLPSSDIFPVTKIGNARFLTNINDV